MTLREAKRINRNRTIGWVCLAISWTAFIMLLAMMPMIHATLF